MWLLEITLSYRSRRSAWTSSVKPNSERGKSFTFSPQPPLLLSCWEILPCPGDAQVPCLDRQRQGVAYKLRLRAPDETCVRCGPVPRKGSGTAGAVPSPGELLLLCAPARSLLGRERRSCSRSTGTHCCAAVRSQVGSTGGMAGGGQLRWPSGSVCWGWILPCAGRELHTHSSE